jgi:superfamily II DNA or RNA helicase
MTRKDVINEAFELVVSRMSLRPPQVAALEKIKDMLLRLPRPLGECEAHEVREFLSYDGFSHPKHPSFLLSLATGVGKTRLAGAVIAMLWLAGESQNFLFLAPSRAVLNRLRNAFNPAFREYIFIERNLVPEPTLIVADQLGDPIATGGQQSIFSESPTVYLLTHQLVASSPRFKKRSNEFSADSPADFLRAKRDLVVISDEAHHLDEGENETAAWVNGITDLAPQLHLGLTATPPRDTKGCLRGWVNLLYEYTLQEALRQELYTKRVELLVHPFPPEIDDSEIERATIRYAIECLESKVNSIRQSTGPKPFPLVKPVVVFFAQDTEHASKVAKQLHLEFQIPEDEILLTHSKKSKTIDEVELLYNIEDSNNPVRYVVNVQELVEGWDVTNVYIIAPLRAMASFAFGVQAMGRGLRLPAGKRVNNTQLDTLDLICFGRTTLEGIIEQETSWSGRSSDGEQLIKTSQWDSPQVSSITVNAEIQREITIEVRDLELVSHELDLRMGPDVFHRIRRMLVSRIRVAAAQVRITAAQERVGLRREIFIDAAAAEVVRQMPRHLSDELHGSIIKSEIERWLEEGGDTSAQIQFNPIEVACAMVLALKASAESEESNYGLTGASSFVTWGPYPITFDVPRLPTGEVAKAPEFGEFMTVGERKDFVRQLPYRGWSRGLHKLYTFDSWHEAKTAKLLDRADVGWWVRNQPRRFRIETSAGMFNPDLVVALRWDSGGKEILLLEVKGDLFWTPPDSKPRLKARAAQEWVYEQNKASTIKWSFGIVLESVVEQVATWEELRARIILG